MNQQNEFQSNVPRIGKYNSFNAQSLYQQHVFPLSSLLNVKHSLFSKEFLVYYWYWNDSRMTIYGRTQNLYYYQSYVHACVILSISSFSFVFTIHYELKKILTLQDANGKRNLFKIATWIFWNWDRERNQHNNKKNRTKTKLKKKL